MACSIEGLAGLAPPGQIDFRSANPSEGWGPLLLLLLLLLLSEAEQEAEQKAEQEATLLARAQPSAEQPKAEQANSGPYGGTRPSGE